MQQLRHRLTASDTFWMVAAAVGILTGCAAVGAGLLVLPPAVVVAGVLSILGCGLILWRPHWGVVLFLGLLYLRPEAVYPRLADLRLPLLLSSFTLFAWLVQLGLKRETFRWQHESAWMLALAAGMVLSTLKLPENDSLLAAGLDGARLFLLVLLVQQLLNTDLRVHFALRALLVFTVGTALLAIRAYYSGGALMEHGTARAILKGGEFDDPNDMAAALVMLVPMGLVLLTDGSSFLERAWGGAAAAVLVFTMFLCDSRGGMLALGAAVLVFLVSRIGWSRGLGLGIAAIVVLYLFGPSRFAHSTLSAEDDSAMGRIWAWHASLGMFESHPFTGVGYKQFTYHFHLVNAAHDSFMQGLAEGGLLVALAWVGLTYWAMLTLVRVQRARQLPGERTPFTRNCANALLSGLAGSVVAGLFLSHTFHLLPKIPVAFAGAMGTIGGAELRPAWKRDWPHFLAIGAITLVAILVFYFITAEVA